MNHARRRSGLVDLNGGGAGREDWKPLEDWRREPLELELIDVNDRSRRRRVSGRHGIFGVVDLLDLEVDAGSIETSAADGASALPRGSGADSFSAEDSAPAVAAAATSGDGTNGVGSFGASSSDAAGGPSLDVFVGASEDAVGGTSGFPFGAD